MIRDQVVDKCASNSIRRRLLRETDLTLDGILRIARSIEASDLHATTMEAASGPSEQQVNQISTGFQQTRQHRGMGRVNKEMRSIQDSRTKTRGSLCVFVVVVRATKRKILHVLRTCMSCEWKNLQ